MKPKEIIFHKKTIWMLLGLLAVWLRAVLSPAVIEQVYSRGIFLLIRRLFDLTTSWWPFAFVYLLFLLVMLWLVKVLITFIRTKRPWRQKVFHATTSLLAFAGGVVFFFLILWGYNYGRVPLEEYLGIRPEPLSIEELRSELDIATDKVLQHRNDLIGSGAGEISESLVPEDLENVIRMELTDLLSRFDYPVTGNVRGRLLFPKGLLLRISTAGVYIPFTGEGHIDPGLHHLQLPFVIAHEMSHGYGFGDEGTCNFLAYLACINAEDPFLQYVGHLYFWRYLASDYRFFQPDAYKTYFAELPEAFKNDLRMIREEMDKYPDILPDVRDAAYNAYLQAQGITEGMKNYDRVIMMVHAWHQKEDSDDG